MKDVLGYSVFDVGLYSSLPYIAMWIVSVTSGFLSDYLIARSLISITFARKMFTAIAAIFPGIFIMGASYSGCERAVVVTFFVLAMGFMGTFYPGMKSDFYAFIKLLSLLSAQIIRRFRICS